MTEPKLKPCPFCGGEAFLDDRADGCYGVYSVFCRECLASLKSYLKKEDAIESWNKRVVQNDSKRTD